jgi:hypothetical protein
MGIDGEGGLMDSGCLFFNTALGFSTGRKGHYKGKGDENTLHLRRYEKWVNGK